MPPPRDLLASIAQLRALLLGMEVQAGLGDLSAVEKDVLYAFRAAEEATDRMVKYDQIRRSKFLEHLSDPTVHRAVRSLVAKGYLEHAPGYKRAAYILI